MLTAMQKRTSVFKYRILQTLINSKSQTSAKKNLKFDEENNTVPTILFIYGWRLFFYSNEGTKLVHVHAEKGDMECKYWMLTEEVEIQEAFSFNMTPSAKKEIKKIIYQHFDLIIESWDTYFNK